MANWSAKILQKGEVVADGTMTYTFSILRDGEVVQPSVDVSDTPENIQQTLEAKVTSYAVAFDVAIDLPAVGDELSIIVDA